MVSRRQSSQLPITSRLILFIFILCIGFGTQAQGSVNVLVELSTVTFENEALLHLRVPRGQTIERATITQNDLSLDLDIAILPLDEKQVIMLDASDSMVNLQQVVQANVSRLWQTDTQETSLILYEQDISTLAPTTRTEDIDNFLVGYNSNPGAPACLGDALAIFDNEQFIRDYDKSWRILLVTVGDFSSSATCIEQEFATAPTALDVIAITGDIDPVLQDLVDRSGGRFYTANLRSIEARINEVIAEFGKLTYAVEGNLPNDWDANESLELEVEFSNGVEESQILSFREYNVPIPATPTPLPPATDTPIPASETPIADTNTTDTEEVAPVPTGMITSDPSEESPTVNNGVAVLLIIAAILFVIGAVVVALALSRVRRRPENPMPTHNANFYETLSGNNSQAEDSLSSTRVRERNIVATEDDPLTQITAIDDTFITDDVDENDELLVTQVLSDKRFQSMMEQSKNDEEIIGWLRLITVGQDKQLDFELRRRGLVVGRSQDCDIQITGDRAISRQHARLDVRNNDQVTVSRLSAVNPVAVGGVQIRNRHPLEPNDVVHLSDETRLIFIARDDDVEIDDTQV